MLYMVFDNHPVTLYKAVKERSWWVMSRLGVSTTGRL